jgi:hypothetical protein
MVDFYQKKHGNVMVRVVCVNELLFFSGNSYNCFNIILDEMVYYYSFMMGGITVVNEDNADCSL